MWPKYEFVHQKRRKKSHLTGNKSVLRIVYLIPETKGYRLKISLSSRQHMSIGKYSGQSAFCCFGYALLFTTFLLAEASESILLLSEVDDKTHRLYFLVCRHRQ